MSCFGEPVVRGGLPSCIKRSRFCGTFQIAVRRKQFALPTFEGGDEMDSSGVIEGAIRQARYLLSVARSPGRSCDEAINEIRTLLWSCSLDSTLSKCSDAVLSLALREAQMAVADPLKTSAVTLELLRVILDDPCINTALGIPHDVA